MMTDYSALAEQAATDREAANGRFQEARAASEKAALRELVFTAASYGVTRLLLEPSDQGDYMTVSEIEPDVESEAEDIIYDAGTYDLSDYSHADWAGETGVEVEEFSHRDDQIRKASIDVKVAAEALVVSDVSDTTQAETNLQVETVMFGNDRLDALDGWQGDAWAVTTPAGDVLSLHLDREAAAKALTKTD